MSRFPTLPQSAKMPKRRNTTLEQERKKFKFNHQVLPPLAVADDVPPGHLPNIRWIKKLVKLALKISANNEMNSHDEKRKAERKTLIGKIQSQIQLASGDEVQNLIEQIDALLVDADVDGAGDLISEYDKQFTTIELPQIAADFTTDETFAFLRVAGPNPRMIQKMTAPHPRFPVTDAGFKSVSGFENDNLQAAMAEGRLYLADYQALAANDPGVNPAPKHNYAPLALFAVPPGKAPRNLQAIAIQCGQDPHPQNPVFYPGDGAAWQMAKTCVNCADGNIHETVAHLGRTHLTIEPFVVCTYRQLHHKHPLHILLAPHFVGTLFINKAARTKLLAVDSVVDKLLSGTLQASIETAVVGIKAVPFNDLALPKFMAARGLMDAHLNYPYRDDAMAVWNAVHNWVSSYLKLYYPNEATVRGDWELQAWAKELGAADGGRVDGFGQDGGIQTLEYLIEAVTTIIFTAGPQHAAVNFPQSYIMSYTPAMPLAGYAPAPSHKNHTEKDWMAMFPPLSMACVQLTFGQLLGSVYFTQLGNYGTRYFKDDRVAAPLTAYMAALIQIEAEINQRNRNRRPYKMLLPSKIPRGINI